MFTSGYRETITHFKKSILNIYHHNTVSNISRKVTTFIQFDQRGLMKLLTVYIVCEYSMILYSYDKLLYYTTHKYEHTKY